MTACVIGLVCAACSSEPDFEEPVAAQNQIRVRRDTFGLTEVTSKSYFGAGYGIGIAQIDDFGLDLPLYWAMLDEGIASQLDNSVFQYLRPGQYFSNVLRFDANSFPVATRLITGAPQISDVVLTYDYTHFYSSVNRAADRISGPLREYLLGYVAGANFRIQQKSPSWRDSTDSRTAYLFKKLGSRVVTLKDPIAASSAQGWWNAISTLQKWVDYIEAIPTLPSPPESLSASNELGVSGKSTRSHKPLLMLDPHLPTHGAFWNRGMAARVQTREIIFDGLVPPGTPVFAMGQAIHLNSGTAMGQTGTANAQDPIDIWFAPTLPDLSRYQSYKTGPEGASFDLSHIGALTIRTGSHGRLIGYNAQRGLGFMFRYSKDFDFTGVEGLWAAFHSKNVEEYRQALDLHQIPAWNIVAGFSSSKESSRLLYINNQVSPVRNPNPDGDSATFTDYEVFLPASDPQNDWNGTYHRAIDLPQVEVGLNDERTFLHCHNCSSDLVTHQTPAYPYMQGGYVDIWNYRQKVGQEVYSSFLKPGADLVLEDLQSLANHKRDLQLEDIVSKIKATFEKYSGVLSDREVRDARAELDLWTGGIVDASGQNPRAHRVLYWQNLMAQSVSGRVSQRVSEDIRRLVWGVVGSGRWDLFRREESLERLEALWALGELAKVNRKWGSTYRRLDEVQRLNPGFGSFPLAGTPGALLSMSGGWFSDPSGLTQNLIYGGQNFVMLMEVGVRSLLKKSVQGTYEMGLPYSAPLTREFSAERFISTGIRPEEWPAARILSSEVFWE